MNAKIEDSITELKLHRQNLSDLQKTKAQYGIDIPLHIKREAEQEEREIKRIEADIRKFNSELFSIVNETRALIVTTISEYTQLVSQVNEFENLFLTYVLLPGFQLQQTIQKRKYLEREYNRIREAIDRGIYASPQEIESDIRQTLKHAEVAYAYKETEQSDESLKSMSPTAPIDSVEPDTHMDESKKLELIKEFKRVVLPKVHSDTSDAPFEVFNAVYEAYKKRDYLLIEAFIIQYRGELHSSAVEDALNELHLATKYSQEYQLILERLERRLNRLKDDTVTQRLENMEAIQSQMKKQNREIRKATYEEAEQILYIRSCLEDLVSSNSKQ